MKKDLLTALENSRNYTIAIAAAMPENGYDSKPVEGIWNFRELLCHIAYGIQWWESNYIKGSETEWNPPPAKNTKKEVVEYLDQSFDALKKTITGSAMNDNLIKGFYATLDHITHHRGQATVHLRHHGITPPEYSY